LVGGGQLAGQKMVEDVDDFLVAFHGVLPSSLETAGWPEAVAATERPF
jgi:hypothetical protein